VVGLLRALANCVPSAQLAVSRISDDRLAGLIETLKQVVEPWDERPVEAAAGAAGASDIARGDRGTYGRGRRRWRIPWPGGSPRGCRMVRVLAYRWADADQAEAYSRR
jgi:hypothetical protein